MIRESEEEETEEQVGTMVEFEKENRYHNCIEPLSPIAVGHSGYSRDRPNGQRTGRGRGTSVDRQSDQISLQILSDLIIKSKTLNERKIKKSNPGEILYETKVL